MRWLWVVVAALLVVGCLTEAQREAREEYLAVAADARAAVVELSAEIKAVKDDIAAGKLPVASGTALVTKLVAEREKNEAIVARADAALKKMKAEEVPWWGYVPWRELGLLALSVATGKSLLTVRAERARADGALERVHAANAETGELRLVAMAESRALEAYKKDGPEKADGATLEALLKLGANTALAEAIRKAATA